MAQKNRVYIWAGQSWTSGREPYSNLPAEFEGYKHNYRVWNGTEFEVLFRNAGNNHFGDSFAGWGMEFPMTVLADDFGNDIYVIKYSIGGTQLAIDAGNDWNASSVGEYSDNLVSYIEAAKIWFTNRGKDFEFRGFIWFQGERDSQDLAEANAYYPNFPNLVDKINNAAGVVMPVYHYYINDFVPAYIFRDEVNGDTTMPIQGKAQFNSEYALSRVVYVNDVTHATDSVHPDANGNQQMYDKYESLFKSDDSLVLEEILIDSDAQNYITAAGIINQTEIDAVDTFVRSYKLAGIWTKFYAIYLISPTSISAAAVNLKNPGTFDLTYVGSPTHASTGVTFDGSTQLAQTGITGSDLTDLDTRMSCYTSGVTILRNGSIDSTTSRLILFSSGTSIFSDHYSSSGGGRESNNTGSNYDGYIVTGRGANNIHEVYQDGVLLGQNPSTSSIGNVTSIPEINFGAWNNAGTPAYGDGEYKAFEVGEYLDSSEEASANSAMTAYQTALGREN